MVFVDDSLYTAAGIFGYRDRAVDYAGHRGDGNTAFLCNLYDCDILFHIHTPFLLL